MSLEIKNKLIEEFSNFELTLNGQKHPSLHSIRRKAIESFTSLGLPTSKNEEWKYTNLNFLINNNFKLITSLQKANIEFKDIFPFLFKELNENFLVFVNGFLIPELSGINLRSRRLMIGSIIEAYQKEIPIIKNFSKLANMTSDPFVALNTAFVNDGTFINIPDNATIAGPIHIIYLNDTKSESIMAQPRTLIAIGANVDVQIIESIHTIGENKGFINTVTEISIGNNSKVEYYKMQDDNLNSYYIGSTFIKQEKDSFLKTQTICLGGSFIRNNFEIILDGEGAEAEMGGIHYNYDKQFVENRTYIEHAKPNCRSNQIFKGVLDDESRAVFNGKILVRPNAQKTMAYQSNKNILLTDKARINSKPQLEIYADDVKCSHGATSGYLDKDALFYLQARGIDESKAKALLLNSFASEIIEKVNIDELRDSLKQKVALRFGVEDIYFCDVF